MLPWFHGAPPCVTAEGVFRWWDRVIYALLTAATIVAIVDFLQHWFMPPDRPDYPASFWLATLLVVGYLAINQLRWLSLLRMRRPRPIPARPGWKVGVATTFVP